MATTAATNAPWTRQPEDREQRMHEQHATEASPCSFWPMRPSLIELCAYYNRLLWQVMLLEQHPYFVQRRSRASGYRRPCSSRAWSACRVGTLPSVFRAGRRLYRSWTVHQCWRYTSTVDSFSFFIRAFDCPAHPAFVLHPRFSRKEQSLFVLFAFVVSPLDGPLPRNDRRTKQNRRSLCS